uniref:F-box domain-containing protein n=1 Tax=Panagrellus redivivus TaxID=6233 RepID=A0A7E4UQY4_PANRE
MEQSEPAIKPHLLPDIVLELFHKQVKQHGVQNNWIGPLCMASRNAFHAVRHVIAKEMMVEVINESTMEISMTSSKYKTFFHLDSPTSIASKLILAWVTRLNVTFATSTYKHQPYSVMLRKNKNISELNISTVWPSNPELPKLTTVFPNIDTLVVNGIQLLQMQERKDPYCEKAEFPKLKCLRVMNANAKQLVELLKLKLPFPLPEEVELHFIPYSEYKLTGSQLNPVKRLTIVTRKCSVSLRDIPAYFSEFNSLETLKLTMDNRCDNGFDSKQVFELHTAFQSLPKDPTFLVTVIERFRCYKKTEMANFIKFLQEMGYRFESSDKEMTEVIVEAIVQMRGNKLTHRVEFYYFKTGYYDRHP